MWGHCSAAPRRRTGCSHWIGTAVPPTARGEVVHHDRSCAVSGVEDRRLATLAWCADAGCLDPPTPAVVANGPARPSSAAGDGGGQSAAGGGRHHGGPRLGV